MPQTAEAQAELNVILRFLDAGMGAGIAGLDAQNRRFAQHVGDASDVLGAYGNQLGMVGRSMGVFQRGLHLLLTPMRAGIGLASGLAGGILGLGFAMRQTDSILHAFNDSMKQQGIDGRQMLTDLTKASGGLVTQASLMQQVNTSIAFMGKETLEKYVETSKRATSMTDVFARMLRGAMGLARSSGRDVQQVFSSMILGAARYDTQILRTIGIQTSMEEATKKWAAKTGQAADDAQTKMMAFLDAVIEKGDEAVEQFGISTGGINTQVQRITTAFSDLALAATRSFDKGFIRPILKSLGDLSVALYTLAVPMMDEVGKTLEKLPEPAIVFVGTLLSLQAVMMVLTPLVGLFAQNLPLVGLALKLLTGPLGVVLAAVLALFAVLRNPAMGHWAAEMGLSAQATDAASEALGRLGEMVSSLFAPFTGLGIAVAAAAEQMINVAEDLLQGDWAGAAADLVDSLEFLAAGAITAADNMARQWGPAVAEALAEGQRQVELFLDQQGPLWDAWGAMLEAAGLDVDAFRQDAVGFLVDLYGDVLRWRTDIVTIITSWVSEAILAWQEKWAGVRDGLDELIMGATQQLGRGIGLMAMRLVEESMRFVGTLKNAAKVWLSALAGFTEDEASWSAAFVGLMVLLKKLTFDLYVFLMRETYHLGVGIAEGVVQGFSDGFKQEALEFIFTERVVGAYQRAVAKHGGSQGAGWQFLAEWWADDAERAGDAAARAAGAAGSQAMSEIDAILARQFSGLQGWMTRIRLMLNQQIAMTERGVSNFVQKAPSPWMTPELRKSLAAEKGKEGGGGGGEPPVPGGEGGGGGSKGTEKDPVAEAYEAINRIASALSAGMDMINKLWREWRGRPPDRLWDELFATLGMIVDRMISFTDQIGGGEKAEEATEAANAVGAFVSVLTGVVDLAAGMARMRVPPRERLDAVFEIAEAIGDWGVEWGSGLIGGDLEESIKTIRLLTDAAGVLSAWATAMVQVAEAAKALQGRRLEINWDRVRAFAQNTLDMAMDLSGGIAGEGGDYDPRVLIDATDTAGALKAWLEALAAILPATNAIARARWPTDLGNTRTFLQGVLQLASDITTGLADAQGYDILIHLEDMKVTVEALTGWLDAIAKIQEVTESIAMARFDVDLPAALALIEDILWFASGLTEALRQSRALVGGGDDLRDHLEEMGLVGGGMAPWLEALVKLGELTPVLERLTALTRLGRTFDVEPAADLLADVLGVAGRLTEAQREGGQLDLVRQEDLGIVAGSVAGWLDVLAKVGEALPAVRAVAGHLAWGGTLDLGPVEGFLVDLSALAGRIWAASKEALGASRPRDWQESGSVAGAIMAWLDLLAKTGDALAGVRAGAGSGATPQNIRDILDILLLIGDEAWLRFQRVIGQTGAGAMQQESANLAGVLKVWIELLGSTGQQLGTLRAGAGAGVRPEEVRAVLDILLLVATEAWGRFSEVIRRTDAGTAGASGAVAASLLSWIELLGKAGEAMMGLRIGAATGVRPEEVEAVLDVLVLVARGAWVRFGEVISQAGGAGRQQASTAVANTLVAWLGILGKVAEALAGTRLAGLQPVSAADVEGLLDVAEVVAIAAWERFGGAINSPNVAAQQAASVAVAGTVVAWLDVLAEMADALKGLRVGLAQNVEPSDLDRAFDVIERIYRGVWARFADVTGAPTAGRDTAVMGALAGTLGALVGVFAAFGPLMLALRTARLADPGTVLDQIDAYGLILARLWDKVVGIMGGRGGDAAYNAELQSAKAAVEALAAVTGLFAALGVATRQASLVETLDEGLWLAIEQNIDLVGDLLERIGDRFKDIGDGDPEGYLGTAKTAIEALGSLLGALVELAKGGADISRAIEPNATEWAAIERTLYVVVGIFRRLVDDPALGVPELPQLAAEWASRWSAFAGAVGGAVGAFKNLADLRLSRMVAPLASEWETASTAIRDLWNNWLALAGELAPGTGNGPRDTAKMEDDAKRLGAFAGILTAAAGAIRAIAQSGISRESIVAMDPDVLGVVEEQARAYTDLLERLEGDWRAGRRDPDRDRELLSGYAELVGAGAEAVGKIVTVLRGMAGMTVPTSLPDLARIGDWAAEVLALFEELSDPMAGIGEAMTDQGLIPVTGEDLERARQAQERTWAYLKAYIETVTAGAEGLGTLVATMKLLKEESLNLGDLTPDLRDQIGRFIEGSIDFWRGLGENAGALSAEGLLAYTRIAAWAETAAKIVSPLQSVASTMQALLALKWVETKVSETQVHRELRDLELGADFIMAVERAMVAMLVAMRNVSEGALPALLDSTDPDRIDVLLAQLAQRAGKVGEIAEAVGSLVAPILAWFGEPGAGGNPLFVSKAGSNWMTRVRNTRADYYAEQLAKGIERTINALVTGVNSAFMKPENQLAAGVVEKAKALFDSVDAIAGALSRVMQMPAYITEEGKKGPGTVVDQARILAEGAAILSAALVGFTVPEGVETAALRLEQAVDRIARAIRAASTTTPNLDAIRAFIEAARLISTVNLPGGGEQGRGGVVVPIIPVLPLDFYAMTLPIMPTLPMDLPPMNLPIVPSIPAGQAPMPLMINPILPDGGSLDWALPPVVIEMPTFVVNVTTAVDAKLTMAGTEIAKALKVIDEYRAINMPSAPPG